MKKTNNSKLIIAVALCACSLSLMAQVTISGALQISSGSPGAGKVLTSDAVGNVSWQTMSGGGPSNDWSLLGNAGTVDGTNFIGNSDNVPLTFRINNIRAGRLDMSNTLLGYRAGMTLPGTTNTENVAIGVSAMQMAWSASKNVAIGNASLRSNNGANFNTAVGYEALFNTQTDKNTGVGYRALYTVGASGDCNTAVGYGADVSSSGLNSMALGYNAYAATAQKVRIGDVNIMVIEGQPSSYSGVSDARFKTNITEEVKGLEFIKLLRPVVYNFDTRKYQEFLVQSMPDSIKKMYLQDDFTRSSAVRHTGFIAQEVEQAALAAGFNFDAIHIPENENDNYSLAYGTFVVPLVKAVQEQQALIEEQAAAIEQLKKEVSLLKGADLTTGLAFAGNGSSMSQNDPNPFTHETSIRYTLPENYQDAYLAVYDLTGKQLGTYALNDRNARSITFTAGQLAAGVYLYSIICDGKALDSRRMVIAGK